MVAASASGDSNTYNYQTQGSVNFNPKSGQVVDNTGAAIVNLNNAPQDYELIAPLFLNTQFLHVRVNDAAQPSGTATVDSSAAIDVSGFSRLALLVTYTLDDSASAVALGLRYRIGTNNGVDSNSVFTVPAYNSYASLSGVTFTRDSIGSVGEIIAQGVSSDKVAEADERVAVFPHKKSGRHTVIYLTERNGNFITGPFLSVRWRHLVTYKGSTAATLDTLSQANRTETRAIFRADLIGWR